MNNLTKSLSVVLLWATLIASDPPALAQSEPSTTVGSSPGSGRPPSKRQIWIGGISPFMQRHRKLDNPSDFLAMFNTDAPWPVASAHMASFKMPSQAVEMSTDDEIRIILDGLRRRHIGLAIEMGLLLEGPDGCGHGFEGMGALHEPEYVIKRMKALGGTIDAVAMDEPVIFGRLKTKGRDDGQARRVCSLLTD